MFALPKGEHFEKQIFVQYGINLTNHIKSNTTFCLLFRLILTFANLVNSTERGPVLWVFKSKGVKKSELDRYRALFFFPWGLPPPTQLGTKCNPYNYNTQFFTKTSQELPIMSRSLSDCQEVTLIIKLLGDLCGMINLIRCFAEKHLLCFWIDFNFY